MARIRKVQIKNFRGIKHLEWCPGGGLHCLVGPGDSGTSTVLDAIELCMRARSSIQFTDADFHRLNVANEIERVMTCGDLAEGLKSLGGTPRGG